MKKLLFYGLIIVSLSYINSAKADIYYHIDDKGVIHYTNYPQNARCKVIFREAIESNSLSSKGSKGSIQEYIRNISNKHNVDPDLVKAIIKVESDSNPNAVSRAGAQGLMQLMPKTCEMMEVNNPFDPLENIQGGVGYFNYLYDKFNKNLELTLAAYNAGETVVMEYKGIPPYPETRNYVRKVLRLYKGYKEKGYQKDDYKKVEPKKIKIYRYVDNEGVIHYTNILPQ